MVQSAPGESRRPPAASADAAAPPASAGRRGAGVHARRVIFIDLARAIAVVFMLYGHAVDALLAPVHRNGMLYDAWQFQRGLTSCLFLLLSGFAFSIATVRHWQAQITWSPALLRRARRFGLFLLLGYVIHVPVAPVSRLLTADDAALRGLFSVDVLHVIGVTFIGVQCLVMLTRTSGRFAAVSVVLAGVVVLATPALWNTDWRAHLPLPLASYLSPATGSLFPVAPWSAFILTGAALGQWYAHRGAGDLGAYANRVLLAPGVGLLAVGAWLTDQQRVLFGHGPNTFVPGDMTTRAGVCLLLLGVVAHLSRRMTRLPHVFGAVAQESLVIYVVHLCIVYGSVWNPGLAHLLAHRMGPGPLVPLVLALIGAMALLAWYWNAWKHTRPALVRRIVVVTSVLMVLRMVG